MAASAPFIYSAVLEYPPDVGAANARIPIGLSGQFASEASFVLNLVGAGTQVVDFGTITPDGAKLVSIEVDAAPSPAAPVNVRFNAGDVTGQVEISPGGFLTIGSPLPTAAGLLALSLVHTTDLCVRVRILG